EGVHARPAAADGCRARCGDRQAGPGATGSRGRVMPSRYYLIEDPTPPGSGDGEPARKAFCVACQQSMTLLQAGTHRLNTGHPIRSKGQIVEFGMPDRDLPKVSA